MTAAEPRHPTHRAEPPAGMQDVPRKKEPRFLCDRCGFEMVEDRCKVICPNCGARLDCSDLNLHFD